MADHKKVAFSTVSSTKESKKHSIKCRTIRLLVTLPESNEKSCPEFNYGDLLSQHLRDRLGKKTMGEVISGPSLDARDPFATDEDEALRILAKQFEKKYGCGDTGKVRKRKRENNDFKTLGEGYDETDPFIDNSDAVDDVVPTNMETKHRGFYINSGALDFEEVEVSEEEDPAASKDSNVQIKRKKRSEISSDEADSAIEEKEENKTKGKEIRENGVVSAKKRDLDEGELLRKRKRMIDKFNAKKLKTDKVDSDSEVKSPLPESPAEESKPRELSIAASIEAVVNKARNAINEQDNHLNETKEDENKTKLDERESTSSSTASSSSSSSSSSADSSSSDSESEEEKESENEEEKKIEIENVSSQDHENGILSPSETESAISLPNNLPKELLEVIDKIKEAGKNSKASSQKFFTDDVKKLLLSIEIKLCNFGGRKKTLIYNHLSQHLPCGTQTLVKRGKNSLTEFLENQMKGPMKRLSDAVSSAMPPLINAYTTECQKIAEQNPQQYWELYYHFWGQGEGHTEIDTPESLKKLKLPKKKFIFTKELREALCEVVKVRCKGLNMLKKRSESPEEHITKFLESEIRNIWPKGWITTKTLYKESESAYVIISPKERIKNATTVPGPKKMTVLGGGTVNNSPNTGNNEPQPPVKNMEESLSSKGISKGDLPQIEKANSSETKESKSKSSLMLPETKITDADINSPVRPQPTLVSADSDKLNAGKSETAVKIIDETPQHSAVSISLISKNLPSETSLKDFPPKAIKDIHGRVQVSSPLSDSSSFLGFESPNRLSPYSNIKEPAHVKLSAVSDSSKKTPNSLTEPLIREGKPPKPSLTATAIPKISLINTKCHGKADTARIDYDELVQHYKSAEDKNINCISIKSVDKINETFKGKSSTKKDSSQVQVTCSTVASMKDKRTLSTDSSKSGDSVSVIELSSDEDKRKVTVSEKCKANESKIEINSSSLKIHPLKDADKDNCTVVTSSNDTTFVKDNKLEQEMDQVMHELLQISMQKKSNEEKSKDSGLHLVVKESVKPPVSVSSKTPGHKPGTSIEFPQNVHQMLPPRSAEPMLSPPHIKTSSPMKSPTSTVSTPIISKKAHLLADPHAHYTPTIDISLQRKSPTTSGNPPVSLHSNPIDLKRPVPISMMETSKCSGVTKLLNTINTMTSRNTSVPTYSCSSTLNLSTSDNVGKSLSMTVTSSPSLSSQSLNLTTSKASNLSNLHRNMMSPPLRDITSGSPTLRSPREVIGSQKSDIPSISSRSVDHSQSMSVDLTMPYKKDLHKRDHVSSQKEFTRLHVVDNIVKRPEHPTPVQRYRQDQLSPHKENPSPKNYYKQQKDLPSHGGSFYPHSSGNVLHSATSSSSSANIQNSTNRSSSSPLRSPSSSVSPYRPSQKLPQVSNYNSNSSSAHMSQGIPVSHRPPQSGNIISPVPSYGGGCSSSQNHHSTSNNDRLSLSGSGRPSHSAQHGIARSRSPVSSHSVVSPNYNSSATSLSPGRNSPCNQSNSSSHSSSKIPSHNIDGLLYGSSYSSQSRSSTSSQHLQCRYGQPQHSTSHKQEKSHSSSSPTATWSHDSVHRPKPSSVKHKSSDSYHTASPTSSHSSTSSSQPKLKHRVDSYTLSRSMLANLTSEQQMELLQSQSSQSDFWPQMNAGCFLPGMPPNESNKYRSQSGSYQGANNSSGGSNKKPSQY